MRLLFLALLIVISPCYIFGQKNAVTLSAGYAFGNINTFTSIGTEANGWLLTGTYDIHPPAGKFVHSLSVGFSHISGQMGGGVAENMKLSTWPACYAPKFVFGNDKWKGYIKSSFGVQYSRVQSEFPGGYADSKWGLTFSAGAGAFHSLNQKFFITAEYELRFVQNSFYTDQLLTTASMGIGMRL